MMEGWIRDLRFALRTALRNPLHSLAVAATLSLGIGATTAIFSVVDATLLRPLPFDEAGELVFLQGVAVTPEGPRVRGASYLEILDWEERSRSFTDVSIIEGDAFTLLADGGEAQRIQGEAVSAGYFELLGVQPALGRTFSPEEDAAPGAGPVAVVSHDLWQTRFGGEPELVGSTIRLNGVPLTVVGVMPEGFAGVGFFASVWVPSSMMFELGIVGADAESRHSRSLGAVGRLAPGVTLEAASREMEAVARQLSAEFPETNTDRSVQLATVRETLVGSTGSLVWVLLGAVGLLLLIACANVTNLLLVRASSRSREVLMRLALGAGRGRLVRQFLIEAIFLAALGTGGGLLLALWGIGAVESVVPTGIFPGFVEVTLDPRVFGFAVGLLFVTGLVSGLVPALGKTRLDLAGALREGARGMSDSGRGVSLRHLLVVGEIAVALVLLVGAGLMMRSFENQLGVDPGFDADRIVAFRLALPDAAYTDEELPTFARELDAALEALPGVEAAAPSSSIPMRGRSAGVFTQFPDTPEEDIRAYLHRVPPDYFDVMGVRLLRGRSFLPEEEEGGIDVAVISESYADRFFPDRDPVGERLMMGSVALTVVGVAAPVRHRDLTSDVFAGEDDPDIYLPFGSFPSRTLEVPLRTATRPEALIGPVREAVARLDPNLPVYLLAPLSTALRNQTAQARFGSFLLVTFSVLALLLAAIGIYGVMAVTVGQRSREIAIRMAMGADGSSVRRLVLSQGAKLIALGLAGGLGGAFALSAFLDSLLFGVERADPLVYAAVAALLALIAVVAVWIPARRATSVDPQRVLTAD